MTKIHFDGAVKSTEDAVETVFKAVETGFKTLKHVKTFNVEDIAAVNYDRVVVFVKAFANTIGGNKVIRDGNIIELPAGESLSFRGIAEYYIIG